MTVGYFDCFSGVAGDMILGAFVDSGMPFSHLEKELKKLKAGGYKLVLRNNSHGSIGGANLHVEISEDKGYDTYSNLKKRIETSSLSKNVKKVSLEILSLLADAEAKVHRKTKKDVHFHEVGCVDSLVDVVGAAVGFEYFGFDEIYASPLPLSRGYVKCAHGILPVPAPATMELLKGLPVEPALVKEEIITPTGVAILKTLCSGFGSSPLRRIDKVGYGFGDKEIHGIVNAVRLMIGEGYPLTVIEANIDDMNPEFYPAVIEKLLSEGAVDAGIVPIVMKKGRPGIILHILCEERDRKKIIETVLKETTTFGVRYFPVERETAEREIKKVKTKYGPVQVKIAKYRGQTTTIAPEYSDCHKIASAKNVPIKEVYRQAIIKA